MKKNIILVLKGMIIGLANIIPGVSGGTLMITLGIYEQIIKTISHFFKNLKENLKFIIPLGIGLVLAILLFSKIISLSLDKYPIATTMLFLGLILGGIPLLIKNMNKNKDSKKISNYLIAFISFAFIIIFAMLKSNTSVDLTNISLLKIIILFFVGIIAAATMVIPGVSGSFVLMLLGYYKPIIDTIKNITDFSLLSHNLLILIPLGIGIVIGIIAVSKLIEILLKKYETKTYFAVFGFVIASIIAILKPVLAYKTNVIEIIIGIIILIIGSYTTYKISNN